MKYKLTFLVLLIAAFTLEACAVFGGGGTDQSALGTPTPIPTAASGYSSGGKIGNHASQFPIPTDVYNYMVLNSDTLNFNTSLNFDEIIAFYTKEFGNAGYTIRESATEINDVNFTVIWDGHDSGRAIVVQGLNLGNGSYNIIVRFDDV
jgi:hypothetical protein